jgi:hypothetical protein
MISFLDPSEQTPERSRLTQAVLNEAYQKLLDGGATLLTPENEQECAAKIHKAYLDHTTKVIEKALIARFGEMPSLDKIARHCRCFYDTQNVAHYVWCDSEPKLGDKIDLSDVLCVVHPPKFGPFGSP